VELLARIADEASIPLWESVLERLPIGAVWCIGGERVGVNPEAARLFGIAARRLPLEAWALSFELADGSGHRLAAHERPMMRALRGEQVPRTRLQILRHDGAEVDVSVQAYPVDGVAGPSAVVLFEDLTFSLEEERRFEEWLAALGHELAGTLHTSTLATRLALRSLGAERTPAHGHLELSLRSAELLGRLVGDFVDAARLGAGNLEWSASQIEVAGFLERVAAAARLADPRHRILLDCDRDVAVRADPHRLEQILTNLFSNARKYSTPGDLTLQVEQTPASAWVTIVLVDSGPGIEPQAAATLFQRYHRLPSREQGSGIGLWLCRELALRMGGDLSVETLEEPRRTAFRLLLPHAQS
jgi:signal transduction histidine kinase